MVRFAVVWLVLSASALVACGPTRTMTLNTDPQGAVVLEPSSGLVLRTPALLDYSEGRPGSDGCVPVHPLVITWASGVSQDYTPRICGSGATFTDTVIRPPGPGRETDEAAAWQHLTGGPQVAQAPAPMSPQTQEAAGEAAYQITCAVLGGCASPSSTGPRPSSTNATPPERDRRVLSGPIVNPRPGCSYETNGFSVYEYC